MNVWVTCLLCMFKCMHEEGKVLVQSFQLGMVLKCVKLVCQFSFGLCCTYRARDQKNRELFERYFPELKTRREQQERFTR